MSDPFSTDSPYVSPQVAGPVQRPASATAFGVLNLVFAGLGLCGMCFTAIPFLGLEGMPDQPPNPVLELIEQDQGYRTFMLVSIALGFVATVVLAISGIGLLMMRNWGRQLAIGYGVYGILSGLVGMAITWIWLLGPLLEQANRAGPGPEQAAAIGGIVGGVVGGCFGMAYPIILLVFMLRPSLARALQ
jgi:hypothetical protein